MKRRYDNSKTQLDETIISVIWLEVVGLVVVILIGLLQELTC